MKNIKKIKGFKDYDYIYLFRWNIILNEIKKIVISYGYNEIIFPLLEYDYLFKNSIGLNNNLINQMFYIKNKNFVLRPEGTSCCIRFGLENGFFRGQKNKWWYFGPMFRYENTQLGRYREFYQFGIECFGYDSIGIDIELILIINKFLKKIKIINEIILEINYIGINYINLYKNDIINFLIKNKEIFGNLNINNINNNPFNILESKYNIGCNNIKNFILKNCPKITKYFTIKDYIYFKYFRKLLYLNKINFYYNPFLFRGINYYSKIIFEYKSNYLNGLSICSGGRYDNLCNKLNNKYNISSVGLAIGWNRLLLILDNKYKKKNNLYLKNKYNIYISLIKFKSLKFTIYISEKIRFLYPKLKILVDYSFSNIKNKIKIIKKNNIYISLIINKKNNINEIFLFNKNVMIEKISFNNLKKIIDKLNFFFKYN
ncbi:histidine--tRNA ligase [endosymbiont of Euscepes postfasciatus]|uniref:ATP phosphoribosyltransferase regulatory subunit n=1 Tax=endosymbiont of Euscepes postfasciatus TaxID=650377 RepID=UPI000DC734FC|nr:ATP phosphoribosyltransferase regulatory subunit [endosymbiont of Euscepes postfasciatus]BBA84736.1 histidine--tRNA ligase [endosymbiont of Euscepes postfasciatus]